MTRRALLLAPCIAALVAGCGVVPASAPPARQEVASLDMVAIPGGSFRMGDVTGDGDPDERPVHPVSIRPFALGRYEVTVAQFSLFAVATGYRTDAERNANGKSGCIALGAEPIKSTYREGLSWRAPGFAQAEREPVVCLSWSDTQAFIGWLNGATGRRFRLPTEAEWEYAARAGTATRYVWGDDLADACRNANGADDTPGPDGERWDQRLNCSDGYYHSAPVGSFAPNAFSLQDMAGNVWEWTQDCYLPSYADAPANGSARVTTDCAKRSIRGSAWPYPAGFLRVANRGGSNGELRANDRGFRLAE